MIHSPFARCWHDSIQYHAFFGERVIATRVFYTPSLWHHSVWLYDGEGTVRELLSSAAPLVQSDAEHIDLAGAGYALSAPDEAAVIDFDAGPGLGEGRLRFTPRATFRWPSIYGPVVHQPNLEAELSLGGETAAGLGYCKRYDWTGQPRYCGWRFIHGERRAAGVAAPRSDGAAIWTADASFAHDKYAYFKLVDPDGTLHEALPPDSTHRDDRAYGVVEGRRYEIQLEELGRWETVLVSSAMDSQLRQRACRMRVISEAGVETGMALTETCFGTLG